MICTACREDKLQEDFVPRRDRKSLFRSYCRSCGRDKQRARYEKYKANSYFKYKATRARSRAQSLRIPCNVTPKYLESIWTEVCPVSGILLKQESDRVDETAAELDRFVPELGYVEGNVTFLSRKINRIKNNVSVEELEALLNWMKTKD